MSSPEDRSKDQPSGLRPTWMLSHAEQLARRASDTTAPRTVHARRSVSAAYYAVFHRLCINLAWTAVPAGSDDTRYALCRVFDHGLVETIAKWVARKDWRTIADYDHLKSVGRPEAVAACDSARGAIEALDAVYGAPEWATFTTLVLLRGSPRSAMRRTGFAARDGESGNGSPYCLRLGRLAAGHPCVVVAL